MTWKRSSLSGVVGVGSTVELIEVEASRAPIRGRRFEVFRSRVGVSGEGPALTVLAFGGNGGRAELTSDSLSWLIDELGVELRRDACG